MIIKGLKWLLGIPSAEDREHNRLVREREKEEEERLISEFNKEHPQEKSDYQKWVEETYYPGSNVKRVPEKSEDEKNEERIAAWRKKNNILVPESELNIENNEKYITKEGTENISERERIERIRRELLNFSPSEASIENNEEDIEKANARLKILELEQQISELEKIAKNKDFDR